MSLTSQPNYRSNSLSALNGRSNSLTSNSSRLSQQPEKIIIRTTKTKDQYGRTTSITTETIRHMGSYELVKKEVKDVSLQPPPMTHHHTGAFGGSPLDNELGSILEEEDGVSDGENLGIDYSSQSQSQSKRGARFVEPQEEGRVARQSLRPPSITEGVNGGIERSKSPVRSILKNGNKRSASKEKRVTLIGDDEEVSDGGSVYSDALDMLPQSHRTVRMKGSNSTLDNVKVSEDTRFTPRQKTYTQHNDDSPPFEETTSKPMSEEDMYQMAYQVALKKVYGEKGESSIPEQKKNGFKTYSLRGERPKSKTSPRISTSRTSSLTSMTRPQVFSTTSPIDSNVSTPIQNPTRSPEMEPTPQFGDRVSDISMASVSPPLPPPTTTTGLGIQEADSTQPNDTKTEKKIRRKTSISQFFGHPSLKYQNVPEVNNTTFKKHTLRSSSANTTPSTKNYNYQINNKFTPEGVTSDHSITMPVVQDDPTVGEAVKSKKEKKKFSLGGLFKRKGSAVKV
ncbi:Meiotic sister-chromatid recombination protein 3 [Cyberlindnera fabianii]|uniref:Meiotic sister-chromatid recombination protein 3 n=1 Tax=Cyberlindnera fabianii TaxID=36022 RepID=A0A1V2L481_CYBFA|nr:Meiotic sister-chromatid recombination protein 3 [Cyberlindnera fabianii]